MHLINNRPHKLWAWGGVAEVLVCRPNVTTLSNSFLVAWGPASSLSQAGLGIQ